MSGFEDVENALLDHDGGCRDVNFDSPTWDGVAQFLKNLERQFEAQSAFDGAGNSLKEPVWETATSSARGDREIILEYGGGAEIITSMRIFIFCEEDGSPFIEISFFPDEVLQLVDLGEKFIAWIGEVQKHLRACGYYCRYESVSWRFGDTGPGSGVFFFASDNAAPTS